MSVTMQMRAAYGMLRAELNNSIVEAASVVNRVQYIPVAEATEGCMSSCTMIELKIVPGLIPAKPEARAAPKATRIILASCLPPNC